MLENSGKTAEKRIREHLSISVSVMVFLLLILSGGLPFWLQVAAGLAIAGGVIYNHFLCRKLRDQFTKDHPA